MIIFIAINTTSSTFATLPKINLNGYPNIKFNTT